MDSDSLSVAALVSRWIVRFVGDTWLAIAKLICSIYLSNPLIYICCLAMTTSVTVISFCGIVRCTLAATRNLLRPNAASERSTSLLLEALISEMANRFAEAPLC